MEKCEGCGEFFLPSVGKQTWNIKEEPELETDDVVVGAHETHTTNTGEHKVKIESDENVVGHCEIPEDEVNRTLEKENQRNDRWEGIEIIDVVYDTEEDDDISTTKDNCQGDDVHPEKEAMDEVDEKDIMEKDKKRAREEDQKGAEENDEKRAREDCPRDDNPRGEQGKDCSTSSSKKKRERNTDWYGFELFKSGLVQQPKNAYFVTKKRKNRPGELYIPTQVIKVYKLELPPEIKLIDSNERQFHVTRKTWFDGRTLYAGGWKALCRVNLVEDDDDIICEFLNNGSDLCIRVRIVKSNERQS